MSETQERIRQVAAELFATHGYARVTIRGIAEAAGVSGALVMKLFGSKAGLYAASTPQVGLPDTEDVPLDELGRYLVGRIVARRRLGQPDPWSQSIMLAAQAPDREAEQRRFQEQVVGHIALHFDDSAESRRRLDAVTAMLVGLAIGLRVLDLGPTDEKECEEFVDRYGALVQTALTGPAA